MAPPSPSSSTIIISRAFFYLCTLCFLSLTTKADLTYIYRDCPSNAPKYAPNSAYQNNLNSLFSILLFNSNTTTGYYRQAVGTASHDVAYGLFLCRGDVSPAACQDCVLFAVTDVVEKCPGSIEATIWYDLCMLRYSNQSIFSVRDSSDAKLIKNAENMTGVTAYQMSFALGRVMDGITTRASESPSFPGKKFATREYALPNSQTLYALAQCTPDLTISDCAACFNVALTNFPECCLLNEGVRYLFPSCHFRYEIYLFYNPNAVGSPPPSSSVPNAAGSPPPSSSVPNAVDSPPPSPSVLPTGKRGISSRVIIAITVSIGIFVQLFIVGFCFIQKRAKKKYNTHHQDTINDEILNIKSLIYDLGTIQVATNNFSDDNKIGQGGYGPVYKGRLPNGEEIAVKRLSQSSGQGAIEFKNELVLVAKLRHKTLVRLLGICLEGAEKILVYEFVPNKSLDYFLFDPQQKVKLTWPRRYNIIGGIARGMLYLHEDSPLTIIHRDLKASNILLDEDMNPKISDFGMARIFKVDQTEENTGRVVGTFGYMSPEYVMHGQFSAKSDVFSLGVLILEVITGKKNNRRVDQANFTEDLLSYAWRLWRDKTPLNLMDPTLEVSYSRNEVMRCIDIALLCVQENPDERPSMTMIVKMLNNYSISIPLPQPPAFFTHRRTQSITLNNQGSNQGKSIWLSVDRASITKLEPR